MQHAKVVDGRHKRRETYESSSREVLLIHSLSDLFHRQSQLTPLDQTVPIPHCAQIRHILRPFTPAFHDAPIDFFHRSAKVLFKLVGEGFGIVEALIRVFQRVGGRGSGQEVVCDIPRPGASGRA